MCFKTPKPPSQNDNGAGAAAAAQQQELQRQQQQAEADNEVIKAANKQTRTEDQIALMEGRMGRTSLFTGSQGGAGYPMPLFRQPGGGTTPPPRPGFPGTGGGGGLNPGLGQLRNRVGSLFGNIGGGSGISGTRTGAKAARQ